MKIQLLHISLTNFKGIREFRADLSHTTNIYGNNATGKTSLFDAFTWLLFGKDSSDRKDFEVKTLDEKNQVIPKIEHEVFASLLVDGQTVNLKRVLREKWVKKRGSLEAEFTGNETVFFWNDVPMQAGEFQKKISDILDEGLFKLITNTTYFNSLKWQDRRTVLLQLAGNISNDQILDGLVTIPNKGEWIGLINVLNQGKTIAEYKREISSQKKLIKDNLDMIPTRIDEATRSMPEAADYEALESQKRHFTEQLANIDLNLSDANKALEVHHKALSAKQTQLHGLKTQLSNRQYQVREQFGEKRREREGQILRLESELKQMAHEKDLKQAAINSNLDKISARHQQLAHLRKNWEQVDAETLVFSEDQFNCPTCRQALPEHDAETHRETLEENFNTNKSAKLAKITSEGKAIKAEVDQLCEANAELERAHDQLADEIGAKYRQLTPLQVQHSTSTANEDQEMQEALRTDFAAADLTLSIEKLQAEIENSDVSTADNTGLLAQRGTITREIDVINQKLAGRDQVTKINERIAQLKVDEKKLAQQLADLERTEFQIEQFNKAKMDLLDQRINGRFKMVRFKMFRTQINGGEEECCEALINGVPFSDANNAARINAGIDIIGTLSHHYGVSAPIFIDNAESVTALLHSEAQIIRMVVSANHQKLTVENEPGSNDTKEVQSLDGGVVRRQRQPAENVELPL